MGQTLTNGIFLPNEGERNCYEGLAGNWRALDYLIGGYNVHVADAVIHVSQEDRNKWDAVTGKADASSLTAHTGNTTIHVTAADKEAWNGKADASALTAHTGNTEIHVTAEDKTKWDAVTSKANDADVVHKSGAETIGGIKTFTSDLLIYNSDTTAYASYFNLKNQKNARGSNQTGGQGLQYQDKYNKTLTMLESRVVSNGNTSFNIICYNVDGNNQVVSDGVSVIKSPTTTSFAPTTDNAVTSGRALAKWSDVLTYKVNGLNPGVLGMPSSTSIDISAYITDLSWGSNQYVAPDNGIVAVDISSTNMYVLYNNNLGIGDRLSGSNFRRAAIIPVRKNDTVIIQSDGGTLNYAKFYPCQGNI